MVDSFIALFFDSFIRWFPHVLVRLWIHSLSHSCTDSFASAPPVTNPCVFWQIWGADDLLTANSDVLSLSQSIRTKPNWTNVPKFGIVWDAIFEKCGFRPEMGISIKKQRSFQRGNGESATNEVSMRKSLRGGIFHCQCWSTR